MATTLEPRVSEDLEKLEAWAGGPPPPPPPRRPTGERLLSLDAFRGFIMFILAANGFGLRTLKDHPGWSWLANQFDHVQWTGYGFWDLIQPAFMFMVGVALPYAIASRRARGATDRQIFKHIAWRCFMLMVWSQIIMSISANRLHLQLINVLSQIAFTYLFTYLILQLRFRWQVIVVAVILAGHWLLFVLFPGSEGAFSKTDNIGAIIDRWLHLYYRGNYVTINFLSSTATTLFGAWTGLLMQRKDTDTHRMKVLAGAAAVCLALGYALTPFNPMVKRIWTASFTLASTGCVLLMLLFFYWLVEVRGHRKVVFPLMVVGMNSIFIYTLSIILAGWLSRAVGVFTFNFKFLGDFGPVAQATATVLVMWYFCYWLYQRKIFFRF